MSNAAESLASDLSDRQVQLLAAVSAAMTGESVDLTHDEWCEAERLYELLESA